LTESVQNKSLYFAALVLFAINVLNFYDRHVPGALVEPMRKEFHLNDTQIGLMGSAFIWLYALVGVPLGQAADTWSRKKLLALGMIVWCALTALAALATNYPFLLFSRVGVGVGEAACAPAATSWLGDLFAPAKRSRVLAIFMLGVPIGGALGFFFGGPIAQSYGWRAAMVLAAAPAILLVPALFLLHEPERGASEVYKTSAENASIWPVLRIPTLWWIIVSGALLNFNAYALATFLPAFLSRVHHLSLAHSGVATGFVYLLGGIAGGLIAGQLGDFIFHRRKDGRLLIASAAAFIVAPLALLGILQPAGSYLRVLAFLIPAYAALVMYYGLVYSAIQDFIAPEQRGLTMAIYFMAMYLCGASFGPLLTGRLSDHLAHRAAALANSPAVTESFRATGLQQAMLIIPLLSVALSLVLYLGSRTIVGDIEKREAAVARRWAAVHG
jgi:predicted MFS family arabinose efflux permease